MKITPIEIRQKTFEKVFRGFDKEEVTAFLQSLSQEWERLNSELRETKMKLEMTEKEVGQLREVETSLFKTLKTADDTAANMVDQAKKNAELKVKEAQIKADEILSDARTQARNVLQKAENKAKTTLQEMINELKSLERDYKTLASYKDNLVVEIKNMVNTTMEKVLRFDTAEDARNEFTSKIKEAQNSLEEQNEKLENFEKEITINKTTNKDTEEKNDSDSSFFDQI